MSEVDNTQNQQSEQALPTPGVSPAPAPAAAAPAQPLNAIQIVEQQIAGFIQQRERAIANVHAIEGALQSAQHLLGVFKTEAAKAEAAAKAAFEKVKADVESVIHGVDTKAEEVVAVVKKEL